MPESKRVEIMQEWGAVHQKAQEGFEARLMGRQQGPNGSDVLNAVGGLARLATAEGDYEDLPRRLDIELDPERLTRLRPIVDSQPARAMVELLREYEAVEYAYRPLTSPREHRSVEIMQCVRLLPAVAAVRAADGDITQAYETLMLLFPIADWLVKERPVILSALLAGAAARLGARHIEELAQSNPPNQDQVADLRRALTRGRKALGVAAVLRGEAAFGKWLLVEDLHDWWEVRAADDRGDDYWQILLEAAEIEPWRRDASDWLERIRGTSDWGPMLIPETRDAIDGLFETRFRVELGLEMLSLYADGKVPEFPVDPFTGEPPRWRSSGDGCVVYGIGRDRQDSGGVDWREERRRDYDVVWRIACDQVPEGLIESEGGGES